MSLIEWAILLFFGVPIVFFSGLFVLLAWMLKEVEENG